MYKNMYRYKHTYKGFGCFCQYIKNGRRIYVMNTKITSPRDMPPCTTRRGRHQSLLVAQHHSWTSLILFGGQYAAPKFDRCKIAAEPLVPLHVAKAENWLQTIHKIWWAIKGDVNFLLAKWYELIANFEEREMKKKSMSYFFNYHVIFFYLREFFLLFTVPHVHMSWSGVF
jgi:hypothetical protein